eukprot:GHVH01005408.1.p3 GENE.GHVH01005408.1~~GHVH01005408.1.p3  ORF type:complete len:252 (+),score=34.02 GHVH01005408.1:3231-3986(+)
MSQERATEDKLMNDEPNSQEALEQKSKYELKYEQVCSFNTADERISDIKWHNMGKHIMASSYDGTWRMYDVVREKEILIQEGHSMEVCSLAVHPDGSLLASGDAGGIIRVWDLRTGRSIMSLENHLRKVLSMDFHPFNGCHLLSAGEDRQGLVWDVRRQDIHDRLLGHTKLISQVKYDSTGEVAVTAGYDGLVKVWDSATFTCMKNLVAHQTLIMGIGFRHQGKSAWLGDNAMAPEMATVGYDRTMKIWRN